MKTIDIHVPTSMLLDHMSFEQLKRVIFGVLGGISPPATVDVNHGMPILATEPADVTQEKIMAELNGARHYLECLEKVQCLAKGNVPESGDELIKAEDKKVLTALECRMNCAILQHFLTIFSQFPGYKEAKRIYKDFGDWSAPPAENQ